MAGSVKTPETPEKSVQPKNGNPKTKSKKARQKERKRQARIAAVAAEKKAKSQESPRNENGGGSNSEKNHKGGTSSSKSPEIELAETLNKLALDSVIPTTGKVLENGNKFKCQMCGSFQRDLNHALRHIRHKSHRKVVKETSDDQMLQQLPRVSATQLERLQHVLINNVVNSEEKLTSFDRDIRLQIVAKVQDVLNDSDEGPYKLQMYGSSLHLCGFKDSDLNLNIRFPSDSTAPETLVHARQKLEDSNLFIDVNCYFSAKNPYISFTDPTTQVKVVLVTSSELAVFTSRFLWIYMKLDPRIEQLCVVFRTWARLCYLDQQQTGSLPPHTFIIMSIFYLQQKGFVPVLNSIFSETDLQTIMHNFSKSKVLRVVGDQLHYHPTCKMFAENTRLGSTSASSDSDQDVDWSDDEVDIPPLAAISNKSTRLTSKLARDLPHKKLAQIWLDLLKFYAFRFDIEEMVVDIRSTERRTRGKVCWSKKRIAVVDPFLPKRNLCKSMGNQQNFTYMMNRLQFSCYYFHGGNMYNRNGVTSSTVDSITPEVEDDPMIQQLIEDFNHEMKTDKSGIVTNGLDEDAGSSSQERETPSDSNNDTEMASGGTSDEATSSSDENRMEFEFTRSRLTGGQRPVTVCPLCKETGHERKDCPQDTVGLLTLDLPDQLTSQVRDNIELFCYENYKRNTPDQEELNMRNDVCHDITAFLIQHFCNDVELSLFGSSRNGFGFKGSDLDMCMTFRGYEDVTCLSELDPKAVIIDVGHKLRSNPQICHVHSITSAKVPIVKFQHKLTGLEGDISLYNTLALCNTRMLKMYSDIDERCQLLGYAMKSLVKSCNIGDASRGSLSSYAYTLMVIFYLQQCNPPVLPVLQEIKKRGTSWKRQVDGWNAYYFDDIKQLPQYWKGQKKNKLSVADLWVGLLRFYSTEFDFSKQVICIRQKAPMSVFEKEWTAKCVCIEDPFALTHNLGGGLSRKMVSYILGVLGRACVHFATPPKSLPSRNQIFTHYLDKTKYTDGEELPNDGCCKNCGKIGHFARDCPHKKRNKNENEDARCYHCNQTGHYKRECPVLEAEAAAEAEKDVKCFNCGQTGHMRRKCPLPKNSQSTGRPNEDGNYGNNQQQQQPRRNNNNHHHNDNRQQQRQQRNNRYNNRQDQSSSSSTPPTVFSPTFPNGPIPSLMNEVIHPPRTHKESRDLKQHNSDHVTSSVESNNNKNGGNKSTTTAPISRSKPRTIPNVSHNKHTGGPNVPMPSSGPNMMPRGSSSRSYNHHYMSSSNSPASSHNVDQRRRRRDSDQEPRSRDKMMSDMIYMDQRNVVRHQQRNNQQAPNYGGYYHKYKQMYTQAVSHFPPNPNHQHQGRRMGNNQASGDGRNTTGTNNGKV